MMNLSRIMRAVVLVGFGAYMVFVGIGGNPLGWVFAAVCLVFFLLTAWQIAKARK
ncbi:hypothetical protein [Corynebacterium auriscanis]|uniref:hypothetical protein n=1 Tax=Corynebacterium auriscanis TaxID=99807 RepID=UPI0024ADC1A7|nr:hypothetical protein [Corynebacterium auriscanis]